MFSPFSYSEEKILLRFPIICQFPTLDPCVSYISLLVSVLFVSVFLWLLLSLLLCSVRHGQRTAAEQLWWVRCKATEKHLINLPSLGLYFLSCDPKTQPIVFFTLFSLSTFIILHSADCHFCSRQFFATQTLNVNAAPGFLPSY